MIKQPETMSSGGFVEKLVKSLKMNMMKMKSYKFT